MIEKLIDRFYDMVVSDPELSPYFEHTPLDNLRGMQREFFGAALGGPVKYTGLELAQAHANRGITRNHFGLYATHLLKALRDIGVSQEDADQVISRINLHVDDVVGRGGISS